MGISELGSALTTFAGQWRKWTWAVGLLLITGLTMVVDPCLIAQLSNNVRLRMVLVLAGKRLCRGIRQIVIGAGAGEKTCHFRGKSSWNACALSECNAWAWWQMQSRSTPS